MKHDPETYRPYLDGLDLTDEQKDELIHILADFAGSFADYVFGDHPLQNVPLTKSAGDSKSPNDPLNSSSDPLISLFDIAANDNDPKPKEKKNAA